MADDGKGREPPKFVSGLGLALKKHAEEQAQPPRGRPRSHAFRNEGEFRAQTGLDINELRRGLARDALQGSTAHPFLHALTHGGADLVSQHGLVPKNLRNANIVEDPQASSNNNTDVFVAGPQVMKGFFHLGPLAPRSDFVHVIGQRHDFMPDSDYQQYIRTGQITSNDSFMHTGAIPPLRDARYGDTGPKSFMVPMSPRTKEGASRYLTGMPGFGDAAEAELKRKFKATFGDDN